MWKQVVDYPNYEVSEEGLVRNAKQQIITKRRYGNYMRVMLYKGGKSKTWRVNRLVATTFELPRRNDQTQVDHINGNSMDDSVTNLRWRTPSENMNDRFALKGTYRDKKQYYLKFENDDEICYFPSIRQACIHFSKCIGNLWAVVKMTEAKGSYSWKGYTVTILTKEQFETETVEQPQPQPQPSDVS